MKQKPFRGVITNWRHHGEQLAGLCIAHVDGGAGMIYTSRVLDIEKHEGYAICTTKNSLYVLIPAEPRAW